MIVHVCDGASCDKQQGDRVPADWVSFTPRRGAGEGKAVIGGTLHFCPECWARLCAAIRTGETL